MGDEIVGCSCGFKFIKSTLAKTEGQCPRCKKQLLAKESLATLYGG